MIIGEGSTERPLSDQELANILREGLESVDLDGKRVVAIIPDATRTAPIPPCFRTPKGSQLMITPASKQKASYWLPRQVRCSTGWPMARSRTSTSSESCS